MSEIDTPASFNPVPPLAIEYARASELGPMLRALGWVIVAVFGVQSIETVIQLLFSIALLQFATVMTSLALVVALPRLLLLAWLTWSAWRLSKGQASAVKPVRHACAALAGLMVLAGVISAAFLMMSVTSRIGFYSSAFGLLKTLLEVVPPAVVFVVLRPFESPGGN